MRAVFFGLGRRGFISGVRLYSVYFGFSVFTVVSGFVGIWEVVFEVFLRGWRLSGGFLFCFGRGFLVGG